MLSGKRLRFLVSRMSMNSDCALALKPEVTSCVIEKTLPQVARICGHLALAPQKLSLMNLCCRRCRSDREIDIEGAGIVHPL